MEETIVETYLRFIKKWFTITDIKCKNNKEIDILALDLNGNKYHLEVKTHVDGWPLEVEEKGRKDVVTVRWFSEYYFQNKFVRSKIQEFFRNNSLDSYKRIIVYWKVRDGLSLEEIKQDARKWRVDDVWLLPEIIRALVASEEVKDNTDAIRAIRLAVETQKRTED